MNRLNKQMDFIMEINKAKDVFRQSILPVSNRRENDAEHSWHIAMMAIVLQEYAKENTNISKVIELLLIHDLVEIYAGDTFAYGDFDQEKKVKREREAGEKLYSILEKDQYNYFLSLWEEYEELKTPEAIFANVLDRLQPLMLQYYTKGFCWKKNSITKEQIYNRIQIAIDYNENFEKYITCLIEDCHSKGYICK